MGRSFNKRFTKEEQNQIRVELEEGMDIHEMQDKYSMATYTNALGFAQKLTGNPNIHICNATRPRTARDAAALLAVEIIRGYIEMAKKIEEQQKIIEELNTKNVVEDREVRLQIEQLGSVLRSLGDNGA